MDANRVTRIRLDQGTYEVDQNDLLVNNRRRHTREVVVHENHGFLEAIGSSQRLSDVESVHSRLSYIGDLKSGLEVQFGVIGKSV